LLIYSATTLDGETDRLRELGGVSRHYLGHGHEAMFPAAVQQAPLFVHAGDRAAAEKSYAVRGTFSRRHMLDDDLEVIPIPGHTPGSTAYLWDTGEQRVLFSADSIYLDDGEWVAAVLSSSDRQTYLDSLELIRELEFDVLAPWAAGAGQAPVAVVDRADARRRIDAIIDRVRAGEDR
jgi:glyoxylase-like metal-dependent hydrolase (beta-lactamase superfamily II)